MECAIPTLNWIEAVELYMPKGGVGVMLEVIKLRYGCATVRECHMNKTTIDRILCSAPAES